MDREESFVGISTAKCRFGLNDEEIIGRLQALLFVAKRELAINCHPLTAFFGHQRYALILNVERRPQIIVKRLVVVTCINTFCVVECFWRQLSQIGRIIRLAVLDRHAALALDLDFKEAKACIRITPHTHLEAFSQPLMMLVISTAIGVIKIARIICKSAAIVDFKYVELFKQGWQDALQRPTINHIFVVDPRHHLGFAVELLK